MSSLLKWQCSKLAIWVQGSQKLGKWQRIPKTNGSSSQPELLTADVSALSFVSVPAVCRQHWETLCCFTSQFQLLLSAKSWNQRIVCVGRDLLEVIQSSLPLTETSGGHSVQPPPQSWPN